MKMPKLVTLNAKDDWFRVISHATLIHGTPERPKVCRTPDGFIIKWFYPRPGISTDKIFPYAKRFIRHSLQLEQKGIESVQVQAWLYDPQTSAHIILYPALEGMTVRDAMTTELATQVMDGFVDYVVDMHERGVFFRGIHLGNVLVREVEQGEGEIPGLAYSLIDITDCRVKHNKLNRWERVRNLKHLFSNLVDNEIYTAYGVQRFIDRYIELTGVEVEMSTGKLPQQAQQYRQQHQNRHVDSDLLTDDIS